MRTLLTLACLMTFGVGLIAGCSTAPKTEAHRDQLIDNADMALDHFKAEDPTVQSFLTKSAGYAIFPTVGKGAAVVGGAYGHGVLYENGQMVGYCNMTQASVGAQVGGQEFSELLVFESQDAINRFKRGDVTFTGTASAIVAKSGAAATAKYDNGVVVFTRENGGLMAEASIAGQRFTYSTTAHVENEGTARAE